ncbi:DUF2382 domain-containing protein [Streptomyces albipurpureus]|uniref:PRC and DUF2382 domain-containing protein n=1 Tax=Streptomyces albipurpureus TaxID=2897419 RepID=A0ABT0UMR9_9ACTN|nr:PRC and DUF2382 domain-containing protein [Streptomyces sp. CWNU-1]MCM2389929.1 PRC and DUF2382 domain-containing protein [Streptomyces sp. CWNU-1]
MITREQVSSVLDHPVHDTDGRKLGDAKRVFFDDASGEPEWISVKTGLFDTHETFVPVRGASVLGDHVEVPYTKDQVKDAPQVEVDAGGHLSEREEHRLYDHYGIDWDAAWKRTGLSGEESAAADARGMSAATDSPDNAMTRSEEHLHVGVERHETGRARLRKYVVTEEEEQTIPVRHEEIRVVREPITDANRGAAMSGTEISEAEYEVTLHEEQPVVDTRAVPVERVRLTVEEQVEETTVRGQVRKERIDIVTPDENDGPS